MSDERPAKRGPAKSRRALFAATTLGLVALAVAAIGEVALQLRELRRQQALQEAWADRDPLFEMHPFLQLSPRPNADKRMRVNEFGFRGAPIAMDRERANPPGAARETLRVFTLGGSTTFSASVAYARTYPAQLGRRLQAALGDREVEMQNASCDWYSSEHSVIRYQFGVRHFRPDVVLAFHAINDLYRSFAPEWFAVESYREDYSHYYGPLIRARRRSELSRLWIPFQQSLLLRMLRGGGAELDARLDPARANPFDERGKSALREGLKAASIREFPSLVSFRANLEQLVRSTRDDGVMLVLATQPSLFRTSLPVADREGLHFALSFASQDGRYPDFDSMVEGMRRFNQVTRDVAERMGVPLVDLEARVPAERQYFSDDVHMTPEGLTRVAEAFEERLIELVAARALSGATP